MIFRLMDEKNMIYTMYVKLFTWLFQEATLMDAYFFKDSVRVVVDPRWLLTNSSMPKNDAW